ncbi:peptidoglycan-binding domain-containing protein [Ilumatobacter coccineus]|uniref:Peptidoglycan binding-like domain-containing protein n=1 Tax=Ilumatobacter coccineus (strain NBRC 103263 / KCTC 29153 / YM16-304) TaxID=1313172 RepID=A0A6C7DVL6_ILUCY|nr:peptidoglycan-binding domain-containing protein [Ilumatobacter coccineus]BAN00754.1 hypothetical protein YM304_04400 [Ilumatobacter coccineus YM16-304]
MNDFTTTSNQNHLADNTGRNIAIGATTAAFVALIGIGSAVALGGSSSAASADVTPAVEAPAVAAPVDAASPVVAEAPASDSSASEVVVIDPIVTLEAAPVEIDPALVDTTAPPAAEAPAPAAAPTQVDSGPCPTYNATNNLPLQLCDKGDWVSDLQRLLTPFADVSTDGYFGPQTLEAVKYMQGVWGFEQNGLVTQELLDVIAKIDPSCNADGSMCDAADWHGDGADNAYDPVLDVNGDGWVSDYERDFPFDAYCDHVLTVANSSAGQIEFSVQDIDDCISWFSHFDD